MKELEEKLQYQFIRKELLEQALTHKSYRHENTPGVPVESIGDNEKLEFLGDAVLDLALSQYLMSQFMNDKEGSLSKKRASLVNEDSLSQIAMGLGLVQFIRLGKGERQTGGGQKPRLLASSFEAIMGAIFMDGGYSSAAQVIVDLFKTKVSQLALEPDYATDFKSRLQELVQEEKRVAPLYRLENELGPDHDKQFEVAVVVENEIWATGRGRSKKAAEQDAAKRALESHTFNKESK